MIVETLIELIPGGLAGAALAWLMRGWISERLKQSIKSEYDTELENLKANLKRDNDVYLAELSAKHAEARQIFDHNLQLARLEHQVKFAGTYQEILKAIKGIHAKLIELQQAVNAYTNIFEFANDDSKEERREKVGQLITGFWEAFNPNRIFFSETLDEEIVTYVQFVTNKSIEFMTKVEKQSDNLDNIDDWNRINLEAKELWSTALKSIRLQFRSILGVEIPNKFEQGADQSSSAPESNPERQ